MNHSSPIDPAAFTYVRTVVSIIVGLSISRLLTGLARFVQHPRQQKIFPAHIAWVFFMLIYVIHFWWWEFRLENVRWTFAIYCFVALYASVLFFSCTLLFPDTIGEYDGFSDYFISRRAWFFGLLIAILILDIVDSSIKGSYYLASLGIAYWLRIFLYMLASIFAIIVSERRFHFGLSVIALIGEIIWAVVFYDSITP